MGVGLQLCDCVMCSGLLPDVGTLNYFSIPIGVACAAEITAPSAMASPATNVIISASRLRADGFRYVSILPPLAGHGASHPFA